MSLKISGATNIASPGNPPGDTDVLPVERPSNNTPMKISLLNIFNYVWEKTTKQLITTKIGAKTNPTAGDIPVLGSNGNLLPDGLALKYVASVADLDNYHTPINSFMVGNSFSNAPDSLTGNAIVIITGSASTSLSQEFRYVGGSNIRIFNRQRVGTTWTAWLETFTTGNVSSIILGNADTVDGKHASEFATSAQGAKADTALQPGTGLIPSTTSSIGSYIVGDGGVMTVGSNFSATSYPINDGSGGYITTGTWRCNSKFIGSIWDSGNSIWIGHDYALFQRIS